MGKRDKVFDLMIELADYAHDDGLPLVSRKLEEALDAFLAETGQVPGAETAARLRKGKRRHIVTRPRAIRTTAAHRVPTGLG